MYYAKTIDEEKAAYKYYGNLNRDNEPDGMGILLGKWTDDIYENRQEYLVVVYYIGEFKDGYKDGYGIEYREDSIQDGICLRYEGEYKEGKYDGKGVMYSGSIADNMGTEYTTIVQARLYGYSTPDVHTYDCLFPNLGGNKLVSYPILISGVSYVGDMKAGEFDGMLFGKLSAPTFFTLNAPVFRMVWINIQNPFIRLCSLFKVSLQQYCINNSSQFPFSGTHGICLAWEKEKSSELSVQFKILTNRRLIRIAHLPGAIQENRAFPVLWNPLFSSADTELSVAC